MLNFKSLLLCGASAALALSAVPASAQSTAPTDASPRTPPAKSATQVGEVVITGTLLRGVAPVGTDVISVSRASIVTSGATSVDQLLSTIPQVTSQFNSVPTVGTTVGISTIRPNIRNIGAAGGTTTLVLMDGHNLVGAGVLQTTPDAGVIPPGALERVEVVADGGSALYGSDAVGGIINFITRKHMEGVEFDGHAGFADNYSATEANLTVGHQWDAGGVLLSYDYRQNTDLLGADRSYYRQNLTSRGGSDFRGTACNPGNVTNPSTGITYALPGLAANTVNQCDTDLYTDLVPEEQQNSLFASLTQAITSRIQFDATAYWTDRRTRQLNAQDSTTGAVITAANPFFIPVGGALAETVSYNYASVFGNSIAATTDLNEYGVTPSLTFDLGHGWQAKALGNYGHSDTAVHTPQDNPVAETAALAGATTTTALDPYNLGMTNPSVLATIHNFENYGDNVQELAEGRLSIDGPVMSLPGGDVRLAAGLQYSHQTSNAVNVTGPVGDLTGAAYAHGKRDVEAEFAELFVPIVGAGNSMAGVRTLSLDLSLRHDQYSDFGGTTNPKVGFTYQPFEGFTILGNYGTSFNAPSLADDAGAFPTTAQVISVSPFIKPGDSFLNFLRPTIVLAGGNPNLKPQTAHTYSIGGEWRPKEVPGLDLGVTFWNVSVYKEIGLVPFISPTLFTTPAYSSYYIINPTLVQAQAATAGDPVAGATSIASLYTPFSSPYILINATRNNLGNEFLDGLDFNASYTRPMSFGAIIADLSGTYMLDRHSQPASGMPKFDELTQGVSRLSLTASLGAMIDQWTVRVSTNYSSGFDVAGIAGQTHVGAFSPVNLYLGYDVKGSGLLHDLTLSLNVDNLFDENPAFENVTGGIGNGSTIGRFFNFGLRKTF
jgi:iron complex outermembrane receptor protein